MSSLNLLLWLPASTYAISYIYLAGYHHKVLLFNTVVHEGGMYTFLQTLFYASHFLGHVPMLTVLALFFTGCVMCLTDPEQDDRRRQAPRALFLMLVIFVCASTAFSAAVFGWTDTADFILQKKQSVVTYVQGGAWNLHLLSTIMQAFLIPVYVFAALKFFRRPVSPNKSGGVYLLWAAFLLVAGTAVLNQDVQGAVVLMWHDPRYLAHSVRELATFPLTFYPLPLYMILKYARVGTKKRGNVEAWLGGVMALLAVIFLAGFTYQVLVPLGQGIGVLAQKPAFARGGHLSVPYLLASHYFEHFLDTIYFCLVCLLFYSWRKTGTCPARRMTISIAGEGRRGPASGGWLL